MKRILSFTLSLIMAVAMYGQDVVSDTLQTASDSVQSANSHAEFSAARQERNVTKAEGDSAYIRNDYASAIQIYENLLKKGEAAEVYYNLGNSYYKADDIARAILNYERALLLEPGNADIRANLEIARSKTIDKIVPVPEIFFVSWTKSLINCLSIDAWAKWGIVFFILLLVSFSLFFFSKQIRVKKIGFIAGIVFMVLVILSNTFAAQQKSELKNRNEAIVLAPSVT
ncbi:MAG: tetratricopeptide repeat protein, partial [Bacteroides sp.]|nr:tetratricopeptide repeat protein [Bacteroides sp.]